MTDTDITVDNMRRAVARFIARDVVLRCANVLKFRGDMRGYLDILEHGDEIVAAATAVQEEVV